MNVRKLVKKIVAIGTGALLVSSAFASSLSGWPMPFVTEDGQGDVQFVIGDGSTSDYLGAIDIAIALQAAAVSESSVDASGRTEVSVEGGAAFGSSSNPLLLGDELVDKEVRFTDADLPVLLADGVVADDDGTEVEYDQELVYGQQSIGFNSDDSDLDDPVLNLDLDLATPEPLYTLTVGFNGGKLDATALNDSETIEIAGKTFTFDSGITKTGKITLYGAETTTLLELNAPVTIESEGKDYTIEIVGASETNENAILDVNGVRKTVKQGNSLTINGLDVYIKNLFVTDIPTLSASVEVFVGSQEVELPAANAAATDVKINEDSVSGIQAQVIATTDNSDITSIVFTFSPEKLNNDIDGYDEINFLLSGESVKDPLFGTFSTVFEGASAALDDSAKSYVRLVQNGEDLELTFTNDDGDEVTFTPYRLEAEDATYTDVKFYNDVTGKEGFAVVADTSADPLTEDMIFAVNEEFGDTKNTVLYEVISFDEDDVDTVTLKNLMTGDSKDYSDGDELGDSSLYIVLNDVATAEEFELENIANVAQGTTGNLYVEGGYHYIKLGTPSVTATTSDTAAVSIEEVSAGVYDATPDTTLDMTIKVDGSEKDEIDVVVDTAGLEADDENDYGYYLTQFGTYVKAETDEDSEAEFWVPKDEDGEVSYAVLVAPEGASVMTSGGSSAVTTQKVNAFAVGAAVRDVDVNLANPTKNLIVVGGTCINSVAAALKGVSEGTCGMDSGLNPNEAIVELFELDNGKVAMLVAGYEAVDTQAASRAIATGDIAEFDKNAVKLTVTSASNYQLE